MRFLTHGDKTNPSLMLVHGMANTSDLFDPLLEYLQGYYVIVCELDGHSRYENSEFRTIRCSCRKIERYVKDELGGRLSGLLGYSLGGTIVAEIIGRRKIDVGKAILDAAFTVKMGLFTCPYTFLFQAAIWCLKKDIRIPEIMIEAVMGKGNAGIIDSLYTGVSLRSIKNACMSIYRYDIKEGLRKYKNPVVFWRGENEPYPKKSAALLKNYLPQMKVRVYRGMGHGQMLNEHPKEYAEEIIAFME